MLLNLKKTESMAINEGKNCECLNPITIDGNQLAMVSKYKHLGLILTSNLDWDEQWNHISKKAAPAIYLIKTMKNLGFKQEILVSVYRAMILSRIITNAPVLCSVSAKANDEMASLQRRALRIIGIDNAKGMKRFNITGVEQTIDKHCKKTMKRILNDEHHPITKGLETKPIGRTRNQFPFVIPTCRLTARQNSFVQKYLRILESENFCPDWYKEKQVQEAAETDTTTKPASEAEQVRCDICGKPQKNERGVNVHKRIKHKQEQLDPQPNSSDKPAVEPNSATHLP